MIKLTQYTCSYFGLLNEWLITQNHSACRDDELPDHGIVCLIDDKPVAAGFLRACEGIAFLDSFVTNPASTSSDRDTALNQITDSLILTAKCKGFKKVVCITSSLDIAKRAQQQGFVISPSIIMSRGI